MADLKAESVSIPSSSGHQFTALLPTACVLLVRRRFNPFFIRASVYCKCGGIMEPVLIKVFQSLLHQGISLLEKKALPGDL